ncbi:DUF3298 and DUF4163 domain-containing protein [Winogradskyella sp.]|uniref:DUF3298 and DUF4163 domain-containing protein n=1 Tax=Winogradskyella sp. TaxID=1883156 RepID=UPI0025EC9227|nr:DUF3298 and DUF4163 domain-containing protein [Winogradskyella sp.]
MKKLSLYILACLLVISCKKEVKPQTFETGGIDRSFDADIEVSYDTANNKSDVAKKINAIVQSEILKSIPNHEDKNSVNEALEAFNAEYIEFSKQFEENKQKWTLAIETEVIYQANEVITMGLSVYTDTGGAHGNDSIELLNFNPSNGELYSQNELFSDLNEFKKLAETYFKDHVKNEGKNISEFFFGKPFQLPENIGFNDEGVILLYNTYEIASYNQGYTEFVIPIEKAEEFLEVY